MAKETSRTYLRRRDESAPPFVRDPDAERTLSVLIVTYKSNDLVEQCLGYVREYLPGLPIFVYENTGDGHPGRDELVARNPDAHWVMGPVNLGFAGALNALVGHIAPDSDLLLLNPDARLLGPLTKTRELVRQPGVAAVSPLMVAGPVDPVAPMNPSDYDNARRKQTLLRALVDEAGYAEQLRRTPFSSLYGRQPVDIDGYVSGACLVINREAWEAIGPFDEEFFLYGEEADWQFRAREAGWRVLLADEVGIEHTGHTTAKDDKAERCRGYDLLRTNKALLLQHQRGVHQADIFLAGSSLLDRVQRSKRRSRQATPWKASDRPTVVIISNQMGYGGAERQKTLLAAELDNRGYRVMVVCLQRFGPLVKEIPHNIRVVRQPWWAPATDIPPGPAVVIGEATNTEAGFATLWRRLGSDRRWLVAAHTPPVPDGPTYSRGLAAAMRRADGFIALAEQHWKELTEYQNLGKRWFVAPNGVVSSHDLADPAETTVWSGDSPLRLVMLSRIMEHKNPQLLINALAGLAESKWELSIFGDGPDRARLEAKTPESVRDRVHWRGWTPGPAHALADCDLLCVPSRLEAFPLVILEAMARKIPVAASGVCAVPEMLDYGKAGIVVEPVTVESWRATLSRVLAAPSDLHAIGNRGFERMIDNYTVESMTDCYEAAIEAVTSSAAPADQVRTT